MHQDLDPSPREWKIHDDQAGDCVGEGGVQQSKSGADRILKLLDSQACGRRWPKFRDEAG